MSGGPPAQGTGGSMGGGMGGGMGNLANQMGGMNMGGQGWKM
jgi:hypothetical protein